VIERSVILCDSESFRLTRAGCRGNTAAESTIAPSAGKLIDRQKEMIEPHWLKARAESQAVPGGSQIKEFRRHTGIKD